MIEKVNERISVATAYSSKKGRTIPFVLEWKNRRIRISEVGFHHYYKEGKKLIHVFEVVADGLMYRLTHDTVNLSWTLEAISDGQAD